VAGASPKNAPWKNFKEAVEILKANPGKYFFTSSSPGSSPHVCLQALFDAVGVKIGHIPSKDSASAIITLGSGTAQFYADPPVFVRQFDLQGMGIFAEKRLEAFPDLPTFKEMGIDVPHFSGWHAFMGPKNLPPDLLARLDAAAKKIVESPEFAEICRRTDMLPSYLNAGDFAKFYKDEYELYGKYLTQFGLKKK
jgi:tripartite-type tricarboxylate transporter receptor subunit TctC